MNNSQARAKKFDRLSSFMFRAFGYLPSSLQPTSSIARNRIPFKVKRTSADNIPVYTIRRFNKCLIFTQVRKIRGDVHVIKDELSQICQTPARIIADGVIEINGDHKSIIKQWLSHNGF